MDQHIFDRIVLVNNLIAHKDNPEESELIKSCKDVVKSFKMLEDENLPYILGMADTVDVFMIFKKFSDDLKPYYIKYLMVKEATSKEN